MENDKSKRTEQIVAAASKVFMRYGFRRVTMADLAQAAQMSRPALYLEFASKEQIFVAVVEQMSNDFFAELRERIPKLKTPEEKLDLAFEIWFVRPYELTQTSPDAADLFESVKEFASETMCKTSVEFEAMLSEILQPLLKRQKSLKITPQQIARIMRTSAKGFKFEAKDADDLRKLIRDMCRIVLASL